MINKFSYRALGVAAFAGICASPMAHAQQEDELDEVVVTGMRTSLENAINLKQNSEQVMDALDLSDIDATPDVTIAEALVRLPGINGARDRGNQSRAAVRGLGPRMVLGTVNGREVASSEPSRNIRFEQYPSELISMVQVYKSQSADLISGGIAGTVNLETVSPLDHQGPDFSARAGLVKYEGGKDIPGYDDLGNRFSGSVIKQINDRFGFALGLTGQKQKNAYPSYQAWGFNTGGQENLPAGGGDLTGAGDFAYVPWGIQAEVKNLETDRSAAMAVLEFAPSADIELKYDVLYSEFDIDEQQNQTWYMDIGNWDNGQAGGFSNPIIIDSYAVALTSNEGTGKVRHVLAAYDQSNSVLAHGLRAEFVLPNAWTAAADLSYSVAERDNYWNALFLDSYGNAFSYDLRTPSVAVPAESPSANPETAELYIDDQNEGSDLKDELSALRVGFEKELSADSSLEFGLRLASRDKKVVWRDYVWSNLESIALQYQQAEFEPGFLSSYTVGQIDTSPFLNAPSYAAAVADLTGGATNLAANEQVDVDASWRVTEDSASAFVKYNFSGELAGRSYTANIGARYVSAATESFAIDASGSSADSVSNDTSELLPSASFNLDLSEDTILRVGMAKAISRPPLDELRAGQYISSISQAQGGNAGNPNLEPFTSTQLDVSYEWYFAPESLFAATAYIKNIDNYIGYTSYEIETTDQAVTIYAPANGEGGTITGLELTFQMPIAFGFGIYSNYAFADSDINEFAPQGNPYSMAGLARDTATLDLWYGIERFEARLGWKYHSAYTTGFEWDGAALRKLDAEENLGLSLAYYLSDMITLRFQGNNLSDEPLRLTQNNNQLDLRRYDVYGRSFLFDVAVKF